MPEEVGIRELLEAGVHFGHQTRRWNPKMRRFIHGERGGIYIIDLLQTQRLLEQASQFTAELARRGGVVLFVGTKKQARDAVKDVAEAAGMPYVNHRWLGGLLTNFQTINQRIRRLHDLERYETEGQLALLPTRERLSAQADLEKLRANLGGVKYMQRTPDAMFVIDLKTEAIAVREAQRLRIPIIGLVDTNCDPDGIDFVVPGNDDAIKSCAIVAHAIGDSARDGRLAFTAEEERQRAEEEERVRREAEERARREAEEQARREAEAQAEAEARAAADPREPRSAAEAQAAQAAEGPVARGLTREAAVTPEAQRDEVAGRRPPPRADRHRPDARSGLAARERGRGRERRDDRRRRGADRAHPGQRDPGTERMTETPQISAKEVAALRQRTGAGMMDAKRALEEAAGDADKAVEILRVKMGSKIGKLAGREAAEGTIQSYIHANGKVGVLVEVDCNTDFVAKNDDFVAFAKDIALHLAASPQTRFVGEEDVPEDARAAEARVFEQQAADKPENVRPRIVEGQLKKWLGEVVLLNQVHVNADKHDGKTIEELRGDLSAKTGENVVIRRFTRFAVGE